MANVYEVTSEEKAQYDKFCTHAIRQLTRPLPPTLWYYTSGATFGRILHDGAIWSTQISCVNDQTEFRYAIRLLGEVVRAFKEAEHDDETRWLAKYIDETLTDDGADSAQFFLLCTSEERDDLSQWRAYGGGEGGVAIGLNANGLLKPNVQNGAYLVPVCYTEMHQKGLVNDVVRWTFNYFKDGQKLRPGADRQKWADSFFEIWRENIIYFAPILKHKAFEREHEWRLIMTLHPTELRRVELQQRHSFLSRHLPVSFGEKLPISEVVVGPCRHPKISVASVGTYLEAKGYVLNEGSERGPGKVTVSASTVPFQTM